MHTSHAHITPLPIRHVPSSHRACVTNRTRFQPGKTEAEAAAYIKQRIAACYLSLRTKGYDQIQWIQQKIPY